MYNQMRKVYTTIRYLIGWSNKDLKGTSCVKPLSN